MLGGSFWISFLRNGLSAGLIITIFMLLEHPAASLRKTVGRCILFCLLVTTGFSFWYLFDSENFIRFAGMLSIPIVGIFCILISRDGLYLLLYKLTLGFYLLTVTIFCGIDSSRLWFRGSIWADIVVRIALAAVIVFIFATKVRKSFLDGVDYLREEMDWFSAVTLLLSVLIAALVAFWPGSHDFSILHIGRTAILLFMTGLIQYMVFDLYLHRGKEKRRRAEHELLEMNEQLIRHQLELIERVREETKGSRRKRICENETVDRILSTYEGWAEKENIQADICVRMAGDTTVSDGDLAAVLANIFENAIYSCLKSGQPVMRIRLSVVQKTKKLAILCRNTCSSDIRMRDGVLEMGTGSEPGVSLVTKIVSFYQGEADFSVENGVFTTRILLNIPEHTQRTP